MDDNFNKYQYDDFLKRDSDSYSKTKYNIILEYLNKNGSKNWRILNAGCGSGELSMLLASAGYNVFGFDPFEEYIDLAKKKASAMSLENCEFRIGSIDDLNSDDKYDCVISTDVLEHIDADYSAMKKLSSVLRPGGIVIIAVPALEILFGYHDEMLGHYRRYSKKNLKRMVLSPKNMQIEKIMYFGFVLVPISYLFSCLLRRNYPIANNKEGGDKSLITKILDILLKIDSAVPTPFGVSLICVAKRLPSD